MDRRLKLYEMEYHEGSGNPLEPTTVLCIGSYKYYTYVIVSEDGAYPAAFVKLPDDHPYRYLENFDPALMNVKCHGGLSFSEYDGNLGMSPEDAIPRGSWIGWDYWHFGDYNGHAPYVKTFAGAERKKWTVDEICDECESVIDQLADISKEAMIYE